MTALLHKGRIVLIADTLVHEWPDENDLATIAIRAAGVAHNLGLEPRVAFVSFSTFGYPVSERAAKMHEAPKVLDRMRVDFEYEGEMTVDVALNPIRWRTILLPPDRACQHPCGASAAFGQYLGQADAGNGRGTVIGPILTGVKKPIQICSTNATVNDILNMAVMAACKVG